MAGPFESLLSFISQSLEQLHVGFGAVHWPPEGNFCHTTAAHCDQLAAQRAPRLIHLPSLWFVLPRPTGRIIHVLAESFLCSAARRKAKLKWDMIIYEVL